jgi:hypothetical protein
LTDSIGKQAGLTTDSMKNEINREGNFGKGCVIGLALSIVLWTMILVVVLRC